MRLNYYFIFIGYLKTGGGGGGGSPEPPEFPLDPPVEYNTIQRGFIDANMLSLKQQQVHVSMTGKPQTNQRHREEETQNMDTETTAITQFK